MATLPASLFDIQVRDDLPPGSMVMVGSRNVVVCQNGEMMTLGPAKDYEPLVPLDTDPDATVSALMTRGLIHSVNRFQRIRNQMFKERNNRNEDIP